VFFLIAKIPKMRKDEFNAVKANSFYKQFFQEKCGWKRVSREDGIKKATS